MCTDNDTEILTLNGFKNIDEINEGEGILSWNPETEIIEEDKILKINKFNHSGDLLSLETEHINLVATSNHRVYNKYLGNNGKYKLTISPLKEIFNLKTPHQRIIPCNGELNRVDYDVSDVELQLIAWIVTEGNIRKSSIRIVSL